MKKTDVKEQSWTDEDMIRGLSRGMDRICWPMQQKQRLLHELEGGTVMKRKLSFAALVCTVITVLLCSCALGLTLQPDETPASQPIAKVENVSFFIPEEENYPSQVLVVEEMQYDGQNLVIGYRMEGDANIREIPFEDTEEALRAQKGNMFGNDHVRTICELFPSVHKKKPFDKAKSALLSRYEWVLDNALLWEGKEEGETVCEKTYVVFGDGDLTYLCFEGLNESLRNKDAVSIRVPLLRIEKRAVWYSYDENLYYGASGTYGNTREIALSVPNKLEAVVFPQSGSRQESACDMVKVSNDTYVIRAQNGCPEYTVCVEESVFGGSQMRLTLDMTETYRILEERPEEVIPYWRYVGTLEEVRSDRETFLAYYEEFWPYLYEMKNGDTLVSNVMMPSVELVDEQGKNLLDAMEWSVQKMEVKGNKRYWIYIPTGFSEKIPVWYEKESFSLYIPFIKGCKMLYADKDGRVYMSNEYRQALPAIPVTVIPWQMEGRFWNDPIYSPYGDVEMTKQGRFLIGDAAELEIVSAIYDGESIEIGYRLQQNDRFRVSQELETVHWEKTAPWTDLSVRYEDGVTYHCYKIRKTKDTGDETCASTAEELNWLSCDYLPFSLVIGELENGALNTQGTPRIRILLQNTAK